MMFGNWTEDTPRCPHCREPMDLIICPPTSQEGTAGCNTEQCPANGAGWPAVKEGGRWVLRAELEWEEARKQGRQAFRDDRSPDVNPHSRGSQLYSEWLSGWTDAHDAARTAEILYGD